MKLDDTNAIKITEDIWWIGFADYEAGFSNNPYLLVDKDEAILFDPGPGHPVFRDLVLQKIQQVTSPDKIKYIVVHHQDPDLCALIPFIENILHPDLIIIAHPRTSLFIPYYGVRKNILPVGDGDILELKSGRKIIFYHTPYLHFAGSMVSYDEKTATLFSSDIFAVFNREWNLFADDSYIELAKGFIQHYISGKEPVLYAYEKLKNLNIKRILPQHGGIIEKNIGKFLEMLTKVEPGQLLSELQAKPTKEQEKELIQAGINWLRFWLKKEINVNTLDELMNYAIQQGPTSVPLLIDSISQKAKEMGVANPLSYSRIHKWNQIQSVRSTQVLDSIRKRFLSRQYGVLYGDDSNIKQILQQGLQSFKVRLSVMFIDIREFTKWSKNRPPDEVINMLNRQHEIITKIINSNGGRVNKIIGDGILSYFPENLIDNSIIIASKIHKLIAENKLLPVGIGCDFGEVIMGDLGEETRLDYTLIGETVNFASRMCDSAGKGEVSITDKLYERLSKKLKEQIKRLPSFENIKIKIKPTDPEVSGIRFKIVKYN